MLNKEEYQKWLITKWQEHYGLIRQTDAAAMLGITKQAIKQKIKNGTIPAIETSYEDKGKEIKVTFIGIIDIGLESMKKKKG